MLHCGTDLSSSGSALLLQFVLQVLQLFCKVSLLLFSLEERRGGEEKERRGRGGGEEGERERGGEGERGRGGEEVERRRGGGEEERRGGEEERRKRGGSLEGDKGSPLLMDTCSLYTESFHFIYRNLLFFV